MSASLSELFTLGVCKLLQAWSTWLKSRFVALKALSLIAALHCNNCNNYKPNNRLHANTWLRDMSPFQIVHGDLAARNVLVFKHLVAKISDFGLSKQLYGCSQYQTKKQVTLGPDF